MTDISSFLTTASIWTGASVGLLKVIDWLLAKNQKVWLTDKAETAWLWLSEQRVGKFVSALHRPKLQLALVLVTHAMILVITLGFLNRVFLGADVDAYLELGHPRLYRWQVWIDVAALALSAGVVSWKIHPRIADWIRNAHSLRSYLARCGKVYGLCILAVFGILIVQYPVVGFHSPMFTENSPAQITAAYEAMLGGMPGVTIVHAVSAVLSAPFFAEFLIVQTILFLSLYWLLLVWALILTFRLLQFVLLRVVESSNGPVLALSGLLIGLGAVAKALT